MAGKKLHIAVAQVNFESANLDRHLERVEDIIRRCRKSDLIIFPELLLHGHPSHDKPEGFLYRRGRILYGHASTKLEEFVKENRARIIIGEIQRKGDSLFNVASLIDENGTQHYRKTHVHWTEHFVPGNRVEPFDTPFGPVGINICFDAAFPEMWRVMALGGPRLMVNISAAPIHFPAEYMHLRMRSAALDNQAFVVFANRPGPVFSGRSAIFGPRGEEVAATGLGESVFSAEVNLDEADRWREEEPVFRHRRPRLYRGLARERSGDKGD